MAGDGRSSSLPYLLAFKATPRGVLRTLFRSFISGLGRGWECILHSVWLAVLAMSVGRYKIRFDQLLCCGIRVNAHRAVNLDHQVIKRSYSYSSYTPEDSKTHLRDAFEVIAKSEIRGTTREEAFSIEGGCTFVHH